MSFNINRVASLIQRDYTYYKKSIGPIIFGFLLFNIVMFIIINYINPNDTALPDFWKKWYQLFLFIMGLIFTLRVFPEFKSDDTTLSYLTLPASNLEKYSTKWLYAIVLFPLLITLTFLLFNWLTPDTSSMSIFGKYNSDNRRAIKAFTLVNTFAFIVAAAGKKRSSTFKESALAVGIGIASFTLLLVIARLLFFSYFDGFSINRFDLNLTQNFTENIAPGFGKFGYIVLYLLPLFFTVVGYFRFKEKEA